MVEGPGCTLNGEKIRGRLVGKTVRSVSGSAVNRDVKKQKREDHMTKYDELIGRKLEEVLTLGKELFLFFGDLCLRIHFLMAGSIRVNNVQLDKDYSKVTTTASLELDMEGDALAFYKSTADIRLSKDCHEKFEKLKDLDICSVIFNPRRAVVMVMEQTGRMVCDVLLDQLILPGVGNIIKNEALYDSGIRPNTKIENLTEDHISLLVKMTRDFTMVFYKCRRDGKPLRPYEKVYHVGKCRQCGGRITTTRMGEDNPRVTYFCDNCQNNDLARFRKQKLSTKNSLLGWVNTGNVQKEVKDWACSVCTLINSANQTNCSVCLTPKDGRPNLTAQNQFPQPVGHAFVPDEALTEQPQNSVVKKSKYTFRKRSLSGLNTSVNTSVSSSADNLVQDSDQMHAKRQKLSTVSRTQNSNPPNQKSTGAKPIPNRSVSEASNRSQGGEVTAVPDMIPPCPGHKRRCFMKQCWKENENRGRWFFTCSLPRAKQCKFFQWADTQFPICEGHGKPCAFRTVMKEGHNNGKKFFACPLGKQKQCGFFQWAVGYED
ncbi:endonuclease 8-like 3 [Haliotis rufescens]|uniref:endonuclease 8-like 3 n=1 Tax=Haliotis rufescens TaxID=6454 RepID=UPI00201EDA8E|nr:endonuclease 8-like 3 [Haliotis rufescens]XP_048244020.1 endonuclease 8-like 3 [Haliotis rufescens]